MPKWFCIFFSAVMLVACMVVGWTAVEKESLRAEMADAALSLETSRGRERKQNYEYAQVQEELPVLLAALAEAQPLADAASETEATLRARRKELRAANKDCNEQLDGLRSELEQTSQALRDLWSGVEPVMDRLWERMNVQEAEP